MTKTINLAIVIPTLNEELYIGKLLDSIILQSVTPKEIVIVDACSEDATIKEIKKRQTKLPQLIYFQVPKYTIASQRNFGVKKTTAKHILFLDADMQLLDPKTLARYYSEIRRSKPDIAAATNFPDSDYWKDKGLFLAMDLTFKTIKSICPVAQGMNLYVRREIFEKNNGFDPEIRCGEDHEFVARVTKRGGKFQYLSETRMYTSVRRIKKVGHLKFATSMTLSFLLDHTIGYKRNPLGKKYEFGNFNS